MLGNNFNGRQCINQLTFTYRVFFILTAAFLIVDVVSDNAMSQVFVNNVTKTIMDLNLWRIFIPFLFLDQNFFGIISLLISFLWLMSTIPPMVNIFQRQERSCSSVYAFTQIFLQNFVLQIVFLIMGFLFYLLFQKDFQSIGWYPLILLMIWKTVAEDPELTTRFCFLPCIIPYKYIGIILLILFLILQPIQLFLSNFIGFCLGYLQFMVLGRSIIRLPFCFYAYFEKIMPNIIKNQPSFIRISTVENKLKSQCFKSNSRNQNPFQRRNNQVQIKQDKEKVNDVKPITGEGIMIGGSSKNYDYRQYWRDKKDEVIQTPKIENQVEKYSYQPPKIQQETNEDLNQSQLSNKPLINEDIMNEQIHYEQKKNNSK